VCSQAFGVSCLFQYFPRRCGGLNPLTALRAYRRERIRQKAFKAMRAVCVASHHMLAVMLQNGFSADKMHLLPLFPTHQNPDPEPPLARSQSGIILLAGRLTRLKGWTHLVPAMAMASKKLGRTLTLAIAGDGPDRLKLLALAEHYQVPVQWYGWLSPEEITAKMRQTDLLAMPSLWPEPFGLVGIEAGCVGTPAVAYAVGGIPDWLIPGVSGEMAPAERLHPAPLADAIARALRNTNAWQRLREGAWLNSVKFCRERHVNGLCHLFKLIAG
jgi:glycosyltransferase involved in cell wall biosynthesis